MAAPKRRARGNTFLILSPKRLADPSGQGCYELGVPGSLSLPRVCCHGALARGRTAQGPGTRGREAAIPTRLALDVGPSRGEAAQSCDSLPRRMPCPG